MPSRSAASAQNDGCLPDGVIETADGHMAASRGVSWTIVLITLLALAPKVSGEMNLSNDTEAQSLEASKDISSNQ